MILKKSTILMLLAVILAAGFYLRLGGIHYGIPSKSQRLFSYNPDESVTFNVIAQWKQIDELNERVRGITALKGIECDILEKGGMDLSDEVLAQATRKTPRPHALRPPANEMPMAAAPNC